MRLIREALRELGIQEEKLRHGIHREVYAVALANNTRSFLRGRSSSLRKRTTWTTKEIADYCKDRWIIPRAARKTGYQLVKKRSILEQLAQYNDSIGKLLASMSKDGNSAL
ncbi:MAG: hypothetical protein ACREX3_23005, partial [Gammaproteobacteria bacterium]